MRRWIVLISLFLLAGCGGGSLNPRLAPGTNADQPGPGTDRLRSAGQLQLRLSAAPEGGEYSLMLSAPGADDVYQIAGTLEYDAARYDLVATEAGGGLGGPEESYFLAGVTQPGKIAFAYTQRRYGPGASGDVNLLRVRVAPRASFSLDDFSLATTPGKLLVRDSRKQAFTVQLEVAP